MHALVPLISVLLLGAGDDALQPGDHVRQLEVDGRQRQYIVHVPRRARPDQPVPVVLALHGAAGNAQSMAVASGLSAKADQAGFVVVYPEGTGLGRRILFWNSGGVRPAVGNEDIAAVRQIIQQVRRQVDQGEAKADPPAATQPDAVTAEIGLNPMRFKLDLANLDLQIEVTWGDQTPPDDVKFIGAVLDDLAKVVPVDTKRVYAAGLSNGAMMCYKLAAEMGDRIAAIATVSGTMPAELEPLAIKRPMPVMHFHGTADRVVPYEGLNGEAMTTRFLKICSVDHTMAAWARANGCPERAKTEDVANKEDDGTTVKRFAWGPGRDGAEVVLYRIEGGGHTWPGTERASVWKGNATRDISANDLIWDFFSRHARK